MKNEIVNDWPHLIVTALRDLDKKEAPHGLYGIREAYKTGEGLPTLAEVLGSRKKTGFFHKLGFSAISKQRHGRVSFTLGSKTYINLQIIDYASTKVRQFGSKYLMDHSSSKKESGLKLDLESILPKLRKDKPSALLLVAHFRSASESPILLGKATDVSFMNKCSIAEASAFWSDVHGRNFSTELHLWYSNVPRAE